MPVEIKELLIKGSMQGDKEPEKKSSGTKSMAKEEGMGNLSYSLRKQIVDQCVQEVMDRIKKMNDL